jgi:DNA processing protein
MEETCDRNLPARLIEIATRLGVVAVPSYSPDYPSNLTPLSDSPALFFLRGTLQGDDKFSVAIVGSRRATRYGKDQAARFAQTFVERGLALVSGGAAGIDTAAHRGALQSGGRTIAVIACGLDITYPIENKALFTDIVEQGGAVLSEFPLGTKPEPWRFPTRNRIIAGMSRLTVVIETPEASGALITARQAAEYGKDVWVVPGPVDTGRSKGGHYLIRDGAYLADSPDDILETLGLADAQPTLPLTAAPAPPTNLPPDEAALLSVLDLNPLSLDDAAEAAGLISPAASVAATLLEMKGLVRRLPGNLFVRSL